MDIEEVELRRREGESETWKLEGRRSETQRMRKLNSKIGKVQGLETETRRDGDRGRETGELDARREGQRLGNLKAEKVRLVD